MQAGKVQELHFVQVDHALFDLFVPGQVGLFLVFQLGEELCADYGVVLAVQGYKVPVKWDRLS